MMLQQWIHGSFLQSPTLTYIVCLIVVQHHLLYVQVSGAGDEDDVADEQLFMQESLELHYNVAELVGTYRVFPMCTYNRRNKKTKNSFIKSRNLYLVHVLILILNSLPPLSTFIVF